MLGSKLSYLLKRGKLKWLGKPLYNSLINIELFYIRYRQKNIKPEYSPLVNAELTVIIKTFERGYALKRLLDSIKQFYPNMHIIVVDDSKQPKHINGVEYILMPYDSGVSAGRQKALEAVKTPYVLLLDDDFIFYSETKLEDAMKTIKKYPQIDIMGGEVVNLPSFKSNDYSIAKLHKNNKKSVLPSGTFIGDLPVYDKVPNFYIARTKRLKLVGWDPNIKRLDHADFFTRAKGILVTVFNHSFKILHAQTPFDKEYMKKRHDIDNDRKVLRLKYYS